MSSWRVAEFDIHPALSRRSSHWHKAKSKQSFSDSSFWATANHKAFVGGRGIFDFNNFQVSFRMPVATHCSSLQEDSKVVWANSPAPQRMWKIGEGERRSAFLLASIALFATAAAQVAIPEISSSVLVFGPSDYVLNGGQSRCQTVVQNALANKQSTLMFVPTAFWVDDGYASLKTVNSQVSLAHLWKRASGILQA